MDEHDWIAPPRIDPRTTPFTETAAFRRFGAATHPNPDSLEAHYTKAVIQEQGFDGLPHVVARRELDRFVAAGEVELYRGVTATPYAEELRTGDFFVGQGGFADGMSTVAGPHALVIARQYAASVDGAVIRMSLKRGARVIDSLDLERQSTVALAAVRATDDHYETMRALYNDYGRYATYLGFDAIRIVEASDIDYYVILNRTAGRMQRENIR